MGLQEATEKVFTAQKINAMTKNFQAMREARIKQERESELFSLKKKQAELQLKAAENDPRVDPGIVSMQRKNLQLSVQQEENKLKIAQKQLDYQMADSTTQMRQLGEKAKALNKMTLENPEIFGDMMIVPDPETGTVSLKSRDSARMKAQSEINRNLSTTVKNNVETAREMAKDAYGIVDEAKFQQYLKDLNATGSPSAAGVQTVTVPEWVPKGKEEQYKAAKAHYNDDEIKQYLGAA